MFDLHCHILPGVDDGPETLEQSVAMARMAAADGVRTIVATPHLDEQYRHPAPELIRELVGRLNDRLRAEGVPLQVLPGAEVRTSPELLEHFAAGQIMTVADRGRFLLLELPTAGHAVYAPQLFFRLQLAGVTPIIAHAERVALFRAEPHRLQELRDRNIRIQINAESLAGQGGRALRNQALRLVRSGLADVIASDGHNLTTRRPLLSVARRALRRQGELFERLTTHIPQSLLSLTAPPPPDGRNGVPDAH